MKQNIKNHKNVLSKVGEITTGKYGELLVASVTRGTIVNKTGYDIVSSEYGKVEVKSRVLGTDGEWPRVTLGKTNINQADYVAVLRFTPDYEIAAACILPISKVAPLYSDYEQKKGGAHIPWDKFSRGAECIKIKAQAAVDDAFKC